MRVCMLWVCVCVVSECQWAHLVVAGGVDGDHEGAVVAHGRFVPLLVAVEGPTHHHVLPQRTGWVEEVERLFRDARRCTRVKKRTSFVSSKPHTVMTPVFMKSTTYKEATQCGE